VAMGDVRAVKGRKLEIGPGRKRSHRIAGYERAGLGPNCSKRVEWGAEPLPYPDSTFVEIFSSHCLEHLPWFRTVPALKEARRVLVSGGRIELWVPDFEYIVECYRKGSCPDQWRPHNEQGDPMLWVNGRIFRYGTNPPDWHRAVFDEGHLRSCLETAGFRSVCRMKKRELGVSHGRIDLGMEGRKP
jgi:SAM-dependent methyltransferase